MGRTIKSDLERIKNLSEEEIQSAALSDPDAQPTDADFWAQSQRPSMRLKYSGYVGSVEYDERDKIWHGHVQGISDVISYEGATVDDLEEDFMDAVDSYLRGLDELKQKSKIESRVYSLKEVTIHLRKRNNLRRLYHMLNPKCRG